MPIYTNLAWPDDPYRTSQQLYRRPCPVLAGVAVLLPGQPARVVPAAVAVAYLPLHRTRAITVTEGTLAFGLRAFSTFDAEDVRELAGLADLDLMQARRHASLLAGHCLPGHLRALRQAAPGLVTRGLDAVEAGWANRQARAQGSATMVDIGADFGDGTGDLASACHDAAVVASSASLTDHISLDDAAGDAVSTELLAAAATERALAIALTCARQLGRYRWQGVLRTLPVMAATTWDLFPHATWDHTSCHQPAT